jgi:hypothetical protein
LAAEYAIFPLKRHYLPYYSFTAVNPIRLVQYWKDMKQLLLQLILILSSTSAFSLDEASSTKPKPAKEQYGAVNVVEDDSLKTLLSVKGVDSLYKTCKENHTVDLDKIPTCIWDGLSDEQKKQVKDVYAQEEAAEKNKNKGRSIASESGSGSFKTNLTGRKLTVGIDYSTDPSVIALSAFFGKKLDEVLGNDKKDPNSKTIKTIDQSKFIELYSSELGKSIVNAFTSYCMEADPSCREVGTKSICLGAKDETTRKKYIQQNLKEVNSAKFTDNEGNWIKCITDVSKVCYEKSKSSDDDEQYSNQKACLIVDFVKTARKNLLAADEQKAFYSSLEKKGIGIASNLEVVDGQKNATGDKLSEITSADIDKDFKGKDNKTQNIAKANDQTIKEVDECSKGNSVEESKCKKFLDTNTDKNTAAVTDFGLREMAKEEDLKEKLKDDSNVQAYLTEEGYTKDQIAEMMKKENIDKVKAEIKDHFSSEKQAVIKEMADKIKSKTSNADGKITKDDAGKIGAIKDELSSRNTDFKNLIHFNNIVSSYLVIQTGDDKKKTTRNTASLMAEVNSMSPEDSKAIKENIKNNKALTNEDTTSNLSVETLNENFLNYSSTPKKPTEK